MENDVAISDAVDWAIKENLLEGFFKLHKAEAVKMILTEFDPELYEQNRKREAYEDGKNDKAIEIAKNALKLGLSEEQITSITGLPPEKIHELKQEL